MDLDHHARGAYWAYSPTRLAALNGRASRYLLLTERIKSKYGAWSSPENRPAPRIARFGAVSNRKVQLPMIS